MQPVLEVPARPDTAEARRAGDGVLGIAVLVVVSLLAAAAALLGRETTVPMPDSATRLPVVAPAANGSAAWDGAEVRDGEVVVATDAENGRVATLRGGEGWSDYTLRARVRWVAGDEAAFLVRSSDLDSYVACVLDGARASIQEVRSGVVRTLASAEVPDYRGRAFDAVVTVAGDEVSFAIDGAVAASARLTGNAQGTAGLAVWDPTRAQARLVAEYVRVERVTAAQPAAAAPRGVRPTVESVDRGD